MARGTGLHTTTVALIAVLLIATATAGCTAPTGFPAKKTETGLAIYTMGTSIGEAPEQSREAQRLRYDITIVNHGPSELTDVKVRPVFHGSLAQRLLQDPEPVERSDLAALAPGKSHTWKRSVLFSSAGIGKSDICSWDPLVKSVFVFWREGAASKSEMISAFGSDEMPSIREATSAVSTYLRAVSARDAKAINALCW